MLRILAGLLLLSIPAFAADWPQFRGPTGDGHYTGPKLPTEWGVDKNVAWKTPIPGKGWSSPVVWKGMIYLTTALPQTNGDQSLRAICVNAGSGKIEWNQEVFVEVKGEAPAIHNKNSHASPTPTIDGEKLYVHFGHMGTAALDLKGNVLWKRTGLYGEPQHGNGGSPVLVDGLLVFSCDGLDKQFVIALNTKDGSTAWQTPRRSNASRMFSFGTPTEIKVDGKKAVISQGSNIIAAYDAKSGKEIWRSKFDGYSLIPKPVVGNGNVYFSTGYDRPQFMAVKLGGAGDVTASHAAWKVGKVAPNTPSPLLIGELIFLVADHGIVTCLDAKTGKIVWEDKFKGIYSASPIYADGKIYVTSEEGKGTLLEAGRKFNVLGEFDMKEKTFASFAGVDGALYVRTESQLYKFAR